MTAAMPPPASGARPAIVSATGWRINSILLWTDAGRQPTAAQAFQQRLLNFWAPDRRLGQARCGKTNPDPAKCSEPSLEWSRLLGCRLIAGNAPSKTTSESCGKLWTGLACLTSEQATPADAGLGRGSFRDAGYARSQQAAYALAQTTQRAALSTHGQAHVGGESQHVSEWHVAQPRQRHRGIEPAPFEHCREHATSIRLIQSRCRFRRAADELLDLRAELAAGQPDTRTRGLDGQHVSLLALRFRGPRLERSHHWRTFRGLAGLLESVANARDEVRHFSLQSIAQFSDARHLGRPKPTGQVTCRLPHQLGQHLAAEVARLQDVAERALDVRAPLRAIAVVFRSDLAPALLERIECRLCAVGALAHHAARIAGQRFATRGDVAARRQQIFGRLARALAEQVQVVVARAFGADAALPVGLDVRGQVRAPASLLESRQNRLAEIAGRLGRAERPAHGRKGVLLDPTLGRLDAHAERLGEVVELAGSTRTTAEELERSRRLTIVAAGVVQPAFGHQHRLHGLDRVVAERAGHVAGAVHDLLRAVGHAATRAATAQLGGCGRRGTALCGVRALTDARLQRGQQPLSIEVLAEPTFGPDAIRYAAPDADMQVRRALTALPGVARVPNSADLLARRDALARLERGRLVKVRVVVVEPVIAANQHRVAADLVLAVVGIDVHDSTALHVQDRCATRRHQVRAAPTVIRRRRRVVWLDRQREDLRRRVRRVGNLRPGCLRRWRRLVRRPAQVGRWSRRGLLARCLRLRSIQTDGALDGLSSALHLLLALTQPVVERTRALLRLRSERCARGDRSNLWTGRRGLLGFWGRLWWGSGAEPIVECLAPLRDLVGRRLHGRDCRLDRLLDSGDCGLDRGLHGLTRLVRFALALTEPVVELATASLNRILLEQKPDHYGIVLMNRL
jgi:hypothetical protein